MTWLQIAGQVAVAFMIAWFLPCRRWLRERKLSPPLDLGPEITGSQMVYKIAETMNKPSPHWSQAGYETSHASVYTEEEIRSVYDHYGWTWDYVPAKKKNKSCTAPSEAVKG